MKDFTLQQYRRLVETFINNGYQCITYEHYCGVTLSGAPLPERFVILRHDVDSQAQQSEIIANIEHELGVQATYYFRVVEKSNQPSKIEHIVAMGHEVGYHYEDMRLFDGDDAMAYNHFVRQLGYFRQYYNVRTICMHGSPRSRYNERELWRKHSYKELGIIGEPYIDTDFSDVFYITDTGRCWDGKRYSVYDKVEQHFEQSFHTTAQIISAINEGKMPKHVLMTTHPQRWNDGLFAWVSELVMQNLKNVVKLIIVKQR